MLIVYHQCTSCNELLGDQRASSGKVRQTMESRRFGEGGGIKFLEKQK